MTGTLSVTWHITPLSPPEPHRHCSSCGGPRAFRSSGKVRLNANGQRLDAWLIYKCTTCDRTWNLPLLDRVRVADLAPGDLQAMQASDPDWVTARAFDLTLLRRHTAQVQLPTDAMVTPSLAPGGGVGWWVLRLRIEAPLPTGLRLDRLLARELCLSRSALQAMQASGGLSRADGGRLALNTPVAGVVSLQFMAANLTDSAHRALSRAMDLPQPDPPR